MTLAQLISRAAGLLESGASPDTEVVIVYDSETCYTDAVRIEKNGSTIGIIGGVEEKPEANNGLCCMARHANAVPPWTCDCTCHATELSDFDKVVRFAAKQQAETVRQMIRERMEQNGR